MLDQDDPAQQPVLADFRLAFNGERLAYESTTLGAASEASGGKRSFGVVVEPGQVRVTVIRQQT